MSKPERTAHDNIVRMVVWFLGSEAILCLALLGALALLERDASDILLGGLLATLGNATGSLGSLLVQTGRGTVQIDQPPGDPVPVERVDPEDET